MATLFATNWATDHLDVTPFLPAIIVIRQAGASHREREPEKGRIVRAPVLNAFPPSTA